MLGILSNPGLARIVRNQERPRTDLPRQAVAAKTSPKTAAEQKAPGDGETDAGIHGFVVYVGAFESGAKAESLAQELRRRKLAAQTSVVDKPGRKPLVSIWVGPFEARAGAKAVLPEIRAAGLEETMIRAVP